MKFKWHYTMVPACICFGPFMASNMGGLGTGWVAPMIGSTMITFGLSVMMGMLVDQRIAIDGLLSQRGQEPTANT